MATLCGYECVAQELIQKDDLILLFIGASSTCSKDLLKWRDANYTFLSTLVLKALSQPVIKYMKTKGCVGHYLRTYKNQKPNINESVAIIVNLIDLLKDSANTTDCLIEDFLKDNGFQIIVELCELISLNDKKLIFASLNRLICAGSELISLVQPASPLSFYPFNLPYTETRSSGVVRIADAFMVFEKSFYVCFYSFFNYFKDDNYFIER